MVVRVTHPAQASSADTKLQLGALRCLACCLFGSYNVCKIKFVHPVSETSDRCHVKSDSKSTGGLSAGA